MKMKERFLKLLKKYKRDLSCVTFNESDRLLDVIIDGFPFITVCESDFDGGGAVALAYAVIRAIRLSEHYTRG